jgi:serine/threonine-protein kinase
VFQRLNQGRALSATAAACGTVGALPADAPRTNSSFKALAQVGTAPRALPGWTTVPADADGSQRLLSQRVGYFAGVFLLLSVAFYLRNALAIAFLERTWPPLTAPPFLLHLGAIVLHALQWLACRSSARSLQQLRWIDGGGLLGAMALYGAVTVSEASSFEHAVAVQSAGGEVFLVALIMVGLTLTHAIIVPLDVRSMFWLSSASCALGMLAAYLVALVGLPAELLAAKPWLPLNQLIFVAVWALLAVTACTIAARIIHGLQQRVLDANEIGQYLLEERIGAGGMGVVYLARHVLLRRPTAVKLLPAHRAGEQAVRRFEQEVRLTSALTHPNTISIFDFGRTPDGVFYYAMEYLDGITLEDLVSHSGAQPAARVAHASGLIHRDIKPANLMLCVRGGMPDQVKVLDFGLVKEFTAEVDAPSSALELIRLLDELTELGVWDRSDAEQWWRERAPEVRQAVKVGRSGGSTPGRVRSLSIWSDAQADGEEWARACSLRRSSTPRGNARP